MPAASNAGRFGYTGQVRLPEVVEAGLYYYKNRMYLSPVGGRFMQPDPIGYGSGPSLYYYVGDDPINWTDPTGLFFPVAGFVAGAAIDYGTQVAMNYANGQTGAAAWTNVNVNSIVVSGALGTLGGFSLIKSGYTGIARFVNFPFPKKFADFA